MDLSGVSGLPIAVDADGSLRAAAGVSFPSVAVRRLEELRPVLRDPAAAGPAEVYRMYRSLARSEHEGWLRERGLRYDVTVLVPGRLGAEYVKTAGHYHPSQPGSPLTFGEVYEVLAGAALFLLQRSGREPGWLEDVVIVEAGPGDKVVIPPGYGHVTVNVGPGHLVLANWVDPSFTALYEPFRALGGAGWFVVEVDGRPEPVPNPRYSRVPEPRRLAPSATWHPHDPPGGPMYLACLADPVLFEALLRPRGEACGYGGMAGAQ